MFYKVMSYCYTFIRVIQFGRKRDRFVQLVLRKVLENCNFYLKLKWSFSTRLNFVFLVHNRTKKWLQCPWVLLTLFHATSWSSVRTRSTRWSFKQSRCSTTSTRSWTTTSWGLENGVWISKLTKSLSINQFNDQNERNFESAFKYTKTSVI